MAYSHKIITLLAATRAASSGQIREHLECSHSAFRKAISTLQRRGLVESRGALRRNLKGRPELVWSLTHPAKQEAGALSGPIVRLATLTLALLRSEYAAAYPLIDFLPVWGDQVAALERAGSRWPWRNNTGKPHRCGALFWGKPGRFCILLPVLNPEHADALLRPLRGLPALPFSLTVAASEQHAAEVEAVLSGQWRAQHPLATEAYTPQQWRVILDTLRPAERAYYDRIEQLLAAADRNTAARNQALSLTPSEQRPLSARVFPVRILGVSLAAPVAPDAYKSPLTAAPHIVIN